MLSLGHSKYIQYSLENIRIKLQFLHSTLLRNILRDPGQSVQMFKMYILYDLHGVFFYLLYVDNILTLKMNEY